MEQIFIKYFLSADNLWTYIHFIDGVAIRQINIYNKKKILLSESAPIIDDEMLCDLPLSELDINEADLISREEFETEWND